MLTKIILGTVATSVLACSGVYAAAASADVINGQTTVSFADLSLDRSADVAVLYERINLAAQQVCHQRALNGAYVVSSGYERCVTDTVGKAVARVNLAPLTTFSQQQRKQMRVASAGPL
jgi:UrcA family protein